MDAPELEWKYLSGFVVKKEATKAGTKRALENLFAPRRGPARMAPMPPQLEIPDESHTHQQQDKTALNLDHNPIRETAPHFPTVPDQPTWNQGPQLHAEQSVPAARQTISGRVVPNTPWYEQSATQRDQGLVAWEVLLDQDDQERIQTAASQYMIQKLVENPFVFAALDSPNILYWDQAMKAHDRDKFIKVVGVELDGHKKMGNYEPIPLIQVSKGTKSIDMVWLI